MNEVKTQDFGSKNSIQVGIKISTGFLAKCLLVALLSSGGFFSPLEAQTATVYPQEHPHAVTNPGMGNRVGANGGAGDYNFKGYMTKAAKIYIPWGAAEKSRTEDLSDLITSSDASFIYAPTHNFKMTPRIFVHQFQPVEEVADHLKPWNYNSETTRDDVLRIIRKLGKVWDKDPRIDAVETGIIGFYGEQQTFSLNGVGGNINNARVGPDQVRWSKIMADAFKEAFPNKPLSVREMKTYSRYGNELRFGTFWDLFASPRQYATGTFQELQDFGDRPNFIVNNNRPPKHYLDTPIYGEMDWSRYYNDPARANDPNRDPLLMIGTSPEELFVGLDSATYSTRYANYVRKTHATAINGMYGSFSPSPTDVNQQKVLKALGYRFHLTEFSTSRRVEPGATLTVNAKIKNLGSAPIYQNYPVYFFLLKNKDDLIPAFKFKIEDIDIRKWHPGSDFNWDPKSNPTANPVYNISPVDNLIGASVTIPPSLANGAYFAGIAIEEPSTNKPGIYFAIPNFFAASQTQPLCQIGVGQDPTNLEMTGVVFDDIHVNDNRGYSLDYYKTLPEVKVEVIRTGAITGPSAVTREPSGNVQFKFTRQASDPSSPLKTDKPLKVTFESGGTATNGVDYQSLPTSVIIPIGSTSVTMNLNVINDTTMERGGETVVVNLTSNQLDYYLTSAKQATVIINDDTDFDMATLGNVELLGSWVQGNSNPAKPSANRALVVLPTAVHLKGATDTSTPLRVSSVSYGGIPMSMVTENSYQQGTSGNYAYSGAFVLGEAGIALATSDVLSVIWQTPDGAAEPQAGSNIASAFFSNVRQLIPSGLPSTTNPLKNSAPSNDFSGRLTFDTSATPEVDEFKNEAGDYIITAGAIYPKDGVYRVDSGFTSFTRLLPDFTYEFGPSGAFFGIKVGSGVAEKPMFGFSYNDRRSMVGFVLKKIGPNSGPNYTLTTAGTNGTVTLNPPGGIYTEGTVVTVTAETDSDFTFGNWSGDFTGSVNPRTITMDGNKSVTANFTPIPTYTLTATGANGSVTLNPPGGIYNQGTVVTVTATPGSGYTFGNWSGDLSGVVDERTITMDGNKSVTANFLQNVEFTGPTGWVSGTSNPKVSGNSRLMTVMVMGESSGDFSATGVTYGGQTMTKRSERLFFVSGNRTYAAMFTLGESGVNAATSGTIAVNWSTSPSVGSAVYSVLFAGVDQANPVSAVANQALSGTSISTTSLVAGSGDLVIICGATENNTDITYNNGFTERFEANSTWGDATGGLKVGVGANETPSFTQSATGRMVLCAMVVKRLVPTFSLATTASNGTVTLNPLGGTYPQGTVVTVTATPNSGFAFSNWSGGLTGSVNPTSVTMNGNLNVTANFTLPTYTLTTAGTNGTVILYPPGGIYNDGTVVTVTAVPDSGFTFSNWSGDLAGSVNPTSITMSANRSVTANFGLVGSKTWDGGGANSNWSTVDNWSDNSAPSGPNAVPYTFAGNIQNTSNNDLPGLVASDFNFTNTGSFGNISPFVLSGSTMTVQNISTTASSSVIADTINFNINTSATRIYDINTNHHLTINGNISGGAGLTKNGLGVLTLSGNNNYNGVIAIQQGTISVSSIADVGSGNPSSIGSGNLRMGNADSGVGTLIYTGSGATTARTVQIGNGNGVSGAIILATGTNGGTGLKFTNASFNTRDTDGATNARGLTLSGPNTDDNTISGVIQNAKTSGVLNLVKEGNGKWILSGANTYTGNTTVSGGTLQLSSTGRLGSGNYGGALAIASGATFQYGGSGNQTLSGVVGTGGGNLSKAGGADLILTNAANAYGALNISAGRVFINSNTGALPTAATVALTGGTLDFNAATATYNNAITMSSGSNIASRVATSLGNVTLPGSGSVIFNNDNDPTVGLTITNPQTLSGTLSIQVGGGNATVGTATLSGNISGGSGAITKIGTGTLALTGNNTYTGTTTVSAGRLILGNNTAGNNGIISDSSNIVVGGGSPGNTAVLQFNRADHTIYAGNITGSSASLAFVDSIGNGNLTLSGNLGTSAIYIKKFTNSGSGAVNLTGTNYAGDTTDLFGTDRSAINVTGTTTTKANGVFIGNNNTGTMSAMNISSSGQFIVANNTAIRVGAGGYDGSATNGASELTITGNALFDTGTTTGIFQLGSSTAANTVGTGTIHLNGGTLSTNRSISGGNVASSTFNFNGGTFKATGTTTTISLNATLGRVNVRNGGAKIDTNGNNISIAQALLHSNISGDLATDGGLAKSGTGTLTLSGANTYTGATTISAGTLAMGASNVLPATAVFIGSATLNAATFTDTLGTLDVTGSATINLGVGAALTFSDSRAIDWSGGTLTITGTFVSGSSLRIGTSSSGLTTTQLSQISKPGGGAVTLNDSGFLIALPATSYTSWASTNASGTTPAQDQDNDGVLNAVEYVLGGGVLTNDLSKLPVTSSSGGNILFTFQRAQTSINATTALRIQVGTTLLTWPDNYTVGADTATSSAGVTVLKGVPAGFDTVTLSVPVAPDLQKFIRLNVNITP